MTIFFVTIIKRAPIFVLAAMQFDDNHKLNNSNVIVQ